MPDAHQNDHDHHPCQVILHTIAPYGRLAHIGAVHKDENLLKRLKTDKYQDILHHLVVDLNSALHITISENDHQHNADSDHDHDHANGHTNGHQHRGENENEAPPIELEDLEAVYLCPNNRAIWLVQFSDAGNDDHDNEGHVHNHACIDLIVKRDQAVKEQHHIPEGGDPSSGDQALGLNSGENSWFESPSTFNLVEIGMMEGIPALKDAQLPTMRVGIIEHKAHTGSFEGDMASHADVVAKIIAQNTDGKVEVISSPMESRKGAPTLFDMICALTNHKIRDVQIVNISQGFSRDVAHPVLLRVLDELGKPVICSSGVRVSDDEELRNWPSSSAEYLNNVYSVSDRNIGVAIDDEHVSVYAKGNWTDAVNGTSFAAAYLSRMFAIAYVLKSRTNLTLDEVSEAIKPYFKLNNLPGNKLEFTDEKLEVKTHENPVLG